MWAALLLISYRFLFPIDIILFSVISHCVATVPICSVLETGDNLWVANSRDVIAVGVRFVQI
jgi:hypothetical protein